MESLQIRRAELDDLDEIVRLIELDSAVPFEARSREEHVRSFEEMNAHPDNELIVATVDGRIAGTLQLTFIPGLKSGWRAQVEAVRVRDDLRDLHIGTRLMEWVIARARERGCYLLQLTTNTQRTDAQRFYKRLGFEPTHVGMKLYL